MLKNLVLDEQFTSLVSQNCSDLNVVSSSPVEVLLIPVDNLIPHPLSLITYQPKPIFQLKLSMNIVGQLENLTVKRDNKGNYLIIDGLSRFFSAKELAMEHLVCNVITIDDSKVPLIRSQINIHLGKTLGEKIRMMDEFLDKIGSSQGKKRDLKEILEISDSGNIPVDLRDRYDIVRTVLGLNISNANARKAHKV